MSYRYDEMAHPFDQAESVACPHGVELTTHQCLRCAQDADYVVTAGLFQRGDFTLHSGEKSGIKLDCDALSDEDIRTIAWMLVGRLPNFGSVEGIPEGGLRLADAIRPYATRGKLLIVDDVYTSEPCRTARETVIPWTEIGGAFIEINDGSEDNG